MSIVDRMLMRTFGHPKGMLGKLGGIIMARTNRNVAYWVIDLLDVQPDDSILEVGYGPGVATERLVGMVPKGYIAGVDYSEEMVNQARARRSKAIEAGLVDLRYGSVENLPFKAGTFDKALAINSMQVWPDAVGGLREIR